MTATQVPPAPLEWHPAYRHQTWLLDWLEGRCEGRTDIIKIPIPRPMRIQDYDQAPDTAETLPTRTLIKHKAFGSAPTPATATTPTPRSGHDRAHRAGARTHRRCVMSRRPNDSKPPGAPPNPMCVGKVKLKDDDGEYLRDEDGEIRRRDCDNHAITGGTVCWTHGGRAPQVRAKAAVRAEVMNWGLGDTAVEPGEVLLRLVSQSSARAELYSQLLSDAFDAAERIRAGLDAEKLLVADEPERTDEDRPEAPEVQTAREDLYRIFNTGGVAALIGNAYADTKDGRIYATGEVIRGLTKLEADERDRCANFAAKAIAAGLAERQVRLAERQAEMVLGAIEAALDAAGIPAGQRGPAKIAAAKHLKVV